MPRDRLLLAEIIDAGERIMELAADGSAADLVRDRNRREALLWNFTVLGEAVGQLSDELKAAHPAIRWSDPVRLRNRIVHGYWSIDVDVLLTAAREDLPPLIAELRSLLRALDDTT